MHDPGTGRDKMRGGGCEGGARRAGDFEAGIGVEHPDTADLAFCHVAQTAQQRNDQFWVGFFLAAQ